jgi:hypothetical protein
LCGASAASQALMVWDESAPAVQVGRWHQTPPGRLFAGLLLSLGVGYGLLELGAAAIMLLARETGTQPLPPAVGWSVLLGLSGLAVLLGALFAAIGARHGKTYGLVIGLLSGGIAVAAVQSGSFQTLAAPYLSSQPQSPAAPVPGLEDSPLGNNLRYALLTLFVVCGLVGGGIGAGIWQIPSRLVLPQLSSGDERLAAAGNAVYRGGPGKPGASPWTGPIAPVRVMLGIAVAAGLAMIYKPIIGVITAFGDPYIKIGTGAEEALAIKEICALAMMLGACLAGATTTNGLKQGLVVGIGAGFAQAMILAAILRVPNAGDHVFFIMLSALFLAPLGGWFGSGLMPGLPPETQS